VVGLASPTGIATGLFNALRISAARVTANWRASQPGPEKVTPVKQSPIEWMLISKFRLAPYAESASPSRAMTDGMSLVSALKSSGIARSRKIRTAFGDTI